MNDKEIQFQFGHVGVYTADSEAAAAAAALLETMFRFPIRREPTAVYAGEHIELLPGGGACRGHIGVLTNDLEGAIALLESRGFRFDRGRFKYGEDGQLAAAYLLDPVCGFQLHLSPMHGT